MVVEMVSWFKTMFRSRKTVDLERGLNSHWRGLKFGFFSKKSCPIPKVLKSC